MSQTELNRVFQMFDRNGDGHITKKELGDSLENLGIFIPDKELSQMIDKIDADGDGCVDISEFGELYRSIMDERNEERDMKEAFDVFDQNGDGFITVDELRSVLASLGLKQGRTVEDCKRMIMKVDVDGDGMVNYKEFREMMKGVQQVDCSGVDKQFKVGPIGMLATETAFHRTLEVEVDEIGAVN
ncbi:Calmodulin-like protein 5 [Morus notabilis]|uniref:Calmodulin-like protein 5 n=1 Tax=Morus notabilis TaxID=981085 RepID=W9RFF4_9ROSA|nr:Calmodulin-like protein 5 [Morus notabilis]